MINENGAAVELIGDIAVIVLGRVTIVVDRVRIVKETAMATTSAAHERCAAGLTVGLTVS